MNPERLDAALRLLLHAGDITPVAARMLTRINDEEQAGYDRAQLVQILIDHQRAGPERCSCGWGEWGRSHAAHVADMYEDELDAMTVGEEPEQPDPDPQHRYCDCPEPRDP